MFLVGKLLSNKQTYKIWLFMWLLQVFCEMLHFKFMPFFGEILILEIPVVGNFSLFAGLDTPQGFKNELDLFLSVYFLSLPLLEF